MARKQVPGRFSAAAQIDQSEKLFADLRKALAVTLKGVDNVRIVPENELLPDEAGKYSIDDPQHLLAYKSADGYPSLFIRHRHRLLGTGNGRAPGEMGVVIVPFRRGDDGRMEKLTKWKNEAMFGTVAERDLLALQGGFELMSFLMSEGLVKVSPSARRKHSS